MITHEHHPEAAGVCFPSQPIELLVLGCKLERALQTSQLQACWQLEVHRQRAQWQVSWFFKSLSCSSRSGHWSLALARTLQVDNPRRDRTHGMMESGRLMMALRVPGRARAMARAREDRATARSKEDFPFQWKQCKRPWRGLTTLTMMRVVKPCQGFKFASIPSHRDWQVGKESLLYYGS
jgi:hypothetical protein